MFLPRLGKLGALVANNWPAKVISIALAVALVMFYRMGALTTRAIIVPLSVEAGHALVPASAPPSAVRVTLRGHDEGLGLIADGDIEAFVDLSRLETEGWHGVAVQARRRGSALEIEPLEISVSPLEIQILLERRVSAILPLVAPIQGGVASGFDLVSHSLSPAEISVSGPTSAIAALSEILTSPVFLDGRSGDFTVELGILSPGPLVSMSGAATAEFHGIVRQAVPVRSISGIPIELWGLPAGFDARAEAQAGSVRIEGSRDLIEGFSPQAGFLFADASGVAGPGLHVLPVRARLPAGFALLALEPGTVSLEIVELYRDEADDDNDTGEGAP